jgi:hypothetical protein
MIQRSQQRQEEELVKRERCFVRKEEGNTPFSLRARMEGSGGVSGLSAISVGYKRARLSGYSDWPHIYPFLISVAHALA